jgi:hypothetical protein
MGLPKVCNLAWKQGEKEPLIGTPCLVTLRRELDLREKLLIAWNRG